jgi:hypothetical protein
VSATAAATAAAVVVVSGRWCDGTYCHHCHLMAGWDEEWGVMVRTSLRPVGVGGVAVCGLLLLWLVVAVGV